MANKDSREAWERFQSDVRTLAGHLREHYEGAKNDQETADLNRSVEELRQAAERVFASLDKATRDPDVRAGTERAARSFGSALAETFREVSEELDNAFRQPAGRGPKS